MVYQQQGRYEEAEMQFTRFLSILESKGKDENVHIANIMHQLATLYQQQDRYFEAERFHLKTLKFRRNLLVKNHPHTLGTIRGLITLYTSWGKPQEAQKWFAELKTAYANQSATYQNTSLEGATDYDSATKNYTLTAIPFIPCMTEKEINFSYPESTSEMWHIHDELHFAHKTLNGDGSITARIESIDQTHWQTKVGVMIRNTLEPISENAVIFITPLGEIVFEYRAKQLEATRSIFSDVKNSTQTCFIRLTRKGNQFTAQHSIDRINWHTIHDENSNQTSSIEIPMKETVYIGLAITSDNTYSTTEAKISNITVTGNVSPNGPFTVSEDISLYSVTLEKN